MTLLKDSTRFSSGMDGGRTQHLHLGILTMGLVLVQLRPVRPRRRLGLPSHIELHAGSG